MSYYGSLGLASQQDLTGGRSATTTTTTRMSYPQLTVPRMTQIQRVSGSSTTIPINPPPYQDPGTGAGCPEGLIFDPVLQQCMSAADMGPAPVADTGAPGWWSQQSTGVKIAIGAGGLLLIGGIIYLAAG